MKLLFPILALLFLLPAWLGEIYYFFSSGLLSGQQASQVSLTGAMITLIFLSTLVAVLSRQLIKEIRTRFPR